MKTTNTTPKTVNSGLKNLRFSLLMAMLAGIGVSLIVQPLWAENPVPGSQDIQISAVKKPTDGKGRLPSFAEADVNGDHVVTKNELQNFPYMLQTFDKVDAGEDGKLEQLEYENLRMETKREGEVR